MSDYFECTPVGLDFLEQTKNVFKAEEIVKASPEQIFEVFRRCACLDSLGNANPEGRMDLTEAIWRWHDSHGFNDGWHGWLRRIHRLGTGQTYGIYLCRLQ